MTVSMVSVGKVPREILATSGIIIFELIFEVPMIFLGVFTKDK